MNTNPKTEPYWHQFVNRCMFVLKQDESRSPVIYAHCMTDVPAAIKALNQILEQYKYVDLDFATAELVRILFGQHPGPTASPAVAIWNNENSGLIESHGDEGVVIIDIDTGQFTRSGKGQVSHVTET